MRSRTTTLGVLFATTTAVVWGGQFVVGKSALESIDAFPLSALRYAVAAGLWLIVLAVLEGPRSLRLDGRGWRLFWLGSLGFAGFNLLAYTGLAHARPQSASLIVALGPLLTALVLWQRTRVRPLTRHLHAPRRGPRRCRARRQRGTSRDDRRGRGRLGRRARPRGRVQLRPLQPRRCRVLAAVAAPLHRADRRARLADDRRGDRRRRRDGPLDLAVGGRALVGDAADRVPGDPGRVRRGADLERAPSPRSGRRTPSSSAT